MSCKLSAFFMSAVLAAGIAAEMNAASVSAVSYKADVSVSAAMADSTENGEAMKKALTIVKSRITIPSEYSEFSHSSNKRNDMQEYSFSWKKPNTYNSYSVTIKGGIITNVYIPTNTPSGMCMTSLSANEIEKKAYDFAVSVNPEFKGKIQPISDLNLSLHSRTVNVRFCRVEGGVNVPSNTVNVSIDKVTGTVSGMNCSWWQGAKFADTSKALSQDKIKEIYRGEISLKPLYRISYDIKSGKHIANIVYVPQNSFIYDAATGKHSTMAEDYQKYQSTDMYINSPVAPDAIETDDDCNIEEEKAMIELTPEELNAVQEQNGLLTSKEFLDLMIKDPYIKVTDKFMVKNYSINKSEECDSGYILSATLYINNSSDYCSYNISADAKTGKVLSFYMSGKHSGKLLDVSASSKTAVNAARYYYGDIFESYVAAPSNLNPAESTKDYKEASRTFSFYRYENNIQVQGNGIYITVNSDGSVTSLNRSHTFGVDFGDGKILTEEKAIEKLFDQKDFDLSFYGFTDLKSVPHTYLSYSLENYTLNAKTGKLCDYNGNAIKKSAEIPALCPYTDIKDSPYKNEIIALYNNGFRFYNDSKLDPKAYVNISELTAMMKIPYSYVPYDRTKYAVPKTGVTSKQAAKRSDIPLLLLKNTSYRSAAELTGIFKSPFKDVSDTDKNIGYYAIAAKLGYITGGKDGKFKPNAAVTREYALHCVYLFITNNQANIYYYDTDEEDIIEDDGIIVSEAVTAPVPAK